MDLEPRFAPLAVALNKPPLRFVIRITKGLYLDPELAQSLLDMLGHLIRNSVDHGFESAEERSRLHKSPSGQILIQLEPAGQTLAFLYADEGAGLDLNTIRAKAAQKGLCAPDESDREKILACLFMPNFSTRHHVTSTSGRGVGLDVVRHELEKWQGQLKWMNLEGSAGSQSRIPFQISLYFPASRAVVVPESPAASLAPPQAS
ncbi:MAG: ATP-binding protein [Pseudobdellovibrionaceae bacterium]|nr:ATP-binding protein [Pseudobdellovibrionaceae bacterium]